MPQTCQRRPVGGSGAADFSLAGERPQHSTPHRWGNRPLVPRERLDELIAILRSTIALRRDLSRRRDNCTGVIRP
jgi:hypothetical protein